MSDKVAIAGKTLKPIHVKAWSLHEDGLTQKEIGSILGKSERSIRDYIRHVQKSIYSDASFASARLNILKLISKAARNLNKYIDGSLGTSKEQYDATMRILENAGLLKKGHDKNGDVNIGNLTAIQGDIKFENRLDVDFAEGAPEQFRRIVDAVKRLQADQVVESG